jgi:hypothetical protein
LILKKINEILSRINQSELVIPSKYKVDTGHITYLRKCTDRVSLDGLWLEFGVYRGRTICNIASSTNSTVYGFDSFDGLHEFWDLDNPAGVYSLNGLVPDGAIDGSNEDNPGMYDSSPTKVTKPWPKNVTLIKGYFNESLPRFLSEHAEQVAFLNIDSDLYSSCKDVLTLLTPRIKSGTIITFDELIGYPTFVDHEIKALAEFLVDTNFSYEVLYYQNPNNYGQVCIKII